MVTYVEITFWTIAIVIVGPLVAWYVKMYRYRHINKLPGPKPVPILGNMLEYGDNIVDFLHNMVRMTKEYGPLVRMWQGPFRLSLIITDPDQVEYFLSSNVHLSKSSGYDLFRPWLGDGLLISTGNKWRKHRKIITPTFHFKILEQFTDIYYTAAKVLIKKLKNVQNKESIDVFSYLNLYALDVICETSMGIKINAQDNKNMEYAYAVKRWLEIHMTRFFSLFKRYPLYYSFTSDCKEQNKCLNIMKNFTINVIEQRKKDKQTGIVLGETNEFGAKRRIAFLDLLLELSEGGTVLSDKDIREEVDTFMFEGHDTVASTMCFGIFEIAKHEHIQKLIYEEIVSIVGKDKNANISMKDVQEMTYLERVVKEVLRKYASVPFVEREIEEDVVIDGIKIPAGTTITFLPYVMHHCEELFPEPDKFDPDRFLPEHTVNRHPFAYIPFSAGPRNCIGQRYAMNLVKATFAYILRNFKLKSVVPEHKLIIGNHAILKSINGFPVKFITRE